MRSRIVLCATGLALGLVATTSAHATSCNLLTDVEGDGRHYSGLQSPSLDLLSGDVASGSSTVVGVVRVAAMDRGDTSTSWMLEWTLSFEVDGTYYSFGYGYNLLDGTPNAVLRGPSGSVIAVPSVVVDATTITWAASRSYFPELGTPGTVFTSLAGMSYLLGGSADTMITAGAEYTDQAPSCVPAA